MEGTNFKDFKEELLSKPNIRKEYEALKPKYAVIQAFIERRNELAISQYDLAQLTGMAQPSISRLERGDGGITLGTLYRVADALDMDLNINVTPRKK